MGSTDLQYPGGFHHGRLALALGELGCFRAVGINSGEALAVLIENGNLPVLVLAALVLAQFGVLSRSFRFCHGPDYSSTEGSRRKYLCVYYIPIDH